jgi:hypothetical protein
VSHNSNFVDTKFGRSPRLAVLQVQNNAPASQSAKNPAAVQDFCLCDPTGIRTPIYAVRGRCPSH